MLLVTVYCPLTIRGAGMALLQIAVPGFVDHCNAKAREFVGHVNTVFVPRIDALRKGPPLVKRVCVE
jgi:hypothetical protein